MWNDDRDALSSVETGSYARIREDQFVVRFDLDVTFEPSGERSALEEVVLFSSTVSPSHRLTVENGEIVQEEFFYVMT